MSVQDLGPAALAGLVDGGPVVDAAGGSGWGGGVETARAVRAPSDRRKVRAGRTSSGATVFSTCGDGQVLTEPVGLTGDG